MSFDPIQNDIGRLGYFVAEIYCFLFYFFKINDISIYMKCTIELEEIDLDIIEECVSYLIAHIQDRLGLPFEHPAHREVYERDLVYMQAVLRRLNDQILQTKIPIP